MEDTFKIKGVTFKRNLTSFSSSSSIPKSDQPIVKLNDKASTEKAFKLKKYFRNDKIYSIISEIEWLSKKNFTHVANMPGNYNEVLFYAKYYGLVVLHLDNIRYVADCVFHQTMT